MKGKVEAVDAILGPWRGQWMPCWGHGGGGGWHVGAMKGEVDGALGIILMGILKGCDFC